MCVYGFDKKRAPWTANEIEHLIRHAEDVWEGNVEVACFPLPYIDELWIDMPFRSKKAIQQAWYRYRNWYMFQLHPKNAFERACKEAYDRYKMESLAMQETTTNKIENDLSAAKVGDRLFVLKYGWCDVIDIFPKNVYPVRVFHKGTGAALSCTWEGKEHVHDTNPTVFWDEVKIVPPRRPKRPLPDLPVDTPVFVGSGRGTPQHFKAWGGGTIMITFRDGLTSHTGALEAGAYWGSWRLMDGSTDEDYIDTTED